MEIWIRETDGEQRTHKGKCKLQGMKAVDAFVRRHYGEYAELQVDTSKPVDLDGRIYGSVMRFSSRKGPVHLAQVVVNIFNPTP